MANSLRHRGPDDESFWTRAQVGLGLAHRRLSIIDLEGGRQPVFNENGRIVTIFNGEIYNYRELREELIARGHQFSTDTEAFTDDIIVARFLTVIGASVRSWSATSAPITTVSPITSGGEVG